MATLVEIVMFADQCNILTQFEDFYIIKHSLYLQLGNEQHQYTDIYYKFQLSSSWIIFSIPKATVIRDGNYVFRTVSH